MSAKGKQADLFDDGALEFEINGVILPDDHSVFKLFPGQTYRLAKVMRETGFVFLDIDGLETLPDDPSEWADDSLLGLISYDRLSRVKGESQVARRRRNASGQDTKRLGFFKLLMLSAKKGDLVLVPLGEGFAGQIAVGELLDEPGHFSRLSYVDNDEEFRTIGRSVRWITSLNRYNLSPRLVASIHSPTAFHLIGSSAQEEVYVGVYGTFAWKDIYVAKFSSDKETFEAQGLCQYRRSVQRPIGSS